MENKKVLLMILDGWGEGKKDKSNAIYTQGSPAIDALRAKYPVSHLMACGEDVGLPEGQMGNSEVGHLNLGAGRVVYQDLVKINIACREHKLLENKEIKAAYEYVKKLFFPCGPCDASNGKRMGSGELRTHQFDPV